MCIQPSLVFTKIFQKRCTYSLHLLWFISKIEEEERKLNAAIEEIEKQNADVNAELKALELKSSKFKELEER